MNVLINVLNVDVIDTIDAIERWCHGYNKKAVLSQRWPRDAPYI